MYWIKEMQRAIGFIEDRLMEELSIEDIAHSANSSTANFQRIFRIVTGMTVGEYIRFRRLSLAGKELAESDAKVLDTALKYGYETAESFTKAFTRFHGVTPSEGRRNHSELKHFLPLSIKIEVRGGFNMQRKLISNVPVIHYDGNNAGFFNTLLAAALQSLGEECDKAKLTALSGAGNRFCWEDGKWVFGNEMPEAINEMPFETESRVLNAIGWKAKYITVQRDENGNCMNIDATQIRRDFVESMDKDFPVIVRHVEHADCNLNLYFGYEDGGRKIICYPYNNHFEPGVSGPADFETPVAKDHWEDNISGYILFQEKDETASERNTALSTFAWVSKHARRKKEINGKLVGFAAWESYLDLLERDDFSGCALFAADAPAIDHIAHSVERRFGIYCDGLCQIYERNQAVGYYRALAETFPEWRQELTIAADALEKCAGYGGFLWTQGFAFNQKGYEKFRDPAARKILADEGRRAMQKDMEAVEQFEKILNREPLISAR